MCAQLACMRRPEINTGTKPGVVCVFSIGWPASPVSILHPCPQHQDHRWALLGLASSGYWKFKLRSSCLHSKYFCPLRLCPALIHIGLTTTYTDQQLMFVFLCNFLSLWKIISTMEIRVYSVLLKFSLSDDKLEVSYQTKHLWELSKKVGFFLTTCIFLFLYFMKQSILS